MQKDRNIGLYLVPSPIGNLGDITYRAVDTLRSVDAILCEDTRTSTVLLKHYDIQKPLYPHHQHNEHKTLEKIIEEIQGGKTYALLTDAGTPAISDPGFLLVRECVRNGVEVECLPGASAFIPALVQSGLPANRFTFEGFPPQKKGRQTFFKKLVDEERTMIFYESPYRLVKTLKELGEHLGTERQAAVARELTKMFEETRRGTLEELAAHYESHTPKGEIVVVVEGRA